MASSAIGATGAIAALPAGSMVDFAGTSAPGGWLMCDGSAVDRTVYASLFASIGTTYGSGDGSTTFNLPDFRGRFARYMDNMGTGAGAAGRDTGRTLGNPQVDSTAVKGLSITSGGTHTHNIDTYNSGTAGGFIPASTASSGLVSRNTGTTGSSHSHTMTGDSETRPINLSCNRIIKY